MAIIVRKNGRKFLAICLTINFVSKHCVQRIHRSDTDISGQPDGFGGYHSSARVSGCSVDLLDESSSDEPAVSDECSENPTGPLHLEKGRSLSHSFCFGGGRAVAEATLVHKTRPGINLLRALPVNSGNVLSHMSHPRYLGLIYRMSSEG